MAGPPCADCRWQTTPAAPTGIDSLLVFGTLMSYQIFHETITKYSATLEDCCKNLSPGSCARPVWDTK